MSEQLCLFSQEEMDSLLVKKEDMVTLIFGNGNQVQVTFNDFMNNYFCIADTVRANMRKPLFKKGTILRWIEDYFHKEN